MIEILGCGTPLEYRPILNKMLDLHQLRVEGEILDRFLILEHRPVYTIGRRGSKENLLIDSGIEIVQIDRGGDITYHGPGQIVIYPIIGIKELGIGIKEFIYRLEEVIIKLLNNLGLSPSRNPLNRGVWIDNRKIASVGVRIKSGVSVHGIAVNINTDLTPFNYINPCGLSGVEITSVVKELDRPVESFEYYNDLEKLLEEFFPECIYD